MQNRACIHGHQSFPIRAKKLAKTAKNSGSDKKKFKWESSDCYFTLNSKQRADVELV